MRFGIFSRLIIGYLAIFALAAAVSLFAVLQSRQFSRTIHDILDIDNVILDHEKQLTDSLLSQVRYERRYVLTKDAALYARFLASGRDCIHSLNEIVAVADTAGKRELAQAAGGHYRRYRALFHEEAAYIKKSKRYRQDWFGREKSREIEAMLEKLRGLRAHCQQNTFEEVRRLREAGAAAQRAIAVITGAALLMGIAVPLIVTRSITGPVSQMISKTREIAGGNLKSDLHISSPPEIGELAGAFNSMCSRLRALDRMKSDFFSSMSHELRTPLASIKEGTSLLLDDMGGNTTGRQKKLFQIIFEESDRMVGLVDSLMDLSKMEAGMMAFHFSPADIASLVRKAAAEAELLAAAKSITLSADPGAGLPIVTIDGERILQVLRNLIGNAVKFTPEGGRVTVSTRTSREGLHVTVSDTGPGIPAENLELVFEKFQQLPLADSYKINGTGLGLAIVRQIITAHGGRVWAESGHGQGSSFIFVLPV